MPIFKRKGHTPRPGERTTGFGPSPTKRQRRAINEKREIIEGIRKEPKIGKFGKKYIEKIKLFQKYEVKKSPRKLASRPEPK